MNVTVKANVTSPLANVTGQVFQSIRNVVDKDPLPPVGVFWGHLALFLPPRQAAENGIDATGLRLGHVLRALAQGIYPDLSSAPPAALRGRRGSPWATPAQEVAASGPGGGCCSFAKTALCCGLEIGGAFPVKLLERAVGGPTLRLSYEHVTI